LVYDKRGVGRSEGEYDEGEDLYVLASDAMRALTVARRHPEIDADRVGLWGRSQGAWVIAAAAEMDGDASFLILEVGGGVTGLEQNVYQRERRMEAVGVPEDARAAVASIQRALWNYYISGEGVEDARRLVADGRDRGLLPRLGAFVPGVREGSPVPGPEWVAAERDGILRWFNRHLTFDPLPHLLRLDVPVLAVFGTADRLTPTGASIRRLEDEAFTGPRSSLLTVAAFDGADHALCPETPGEVIVPDCTFVAGYPDVVASWLSELTLERATTRGR
jgi:pimeloyl-ACP methyl ester carboxylesterase